MIVKKILSLFKTGTIKDSFVIAIGLGGSAFIGFIYTILLARSLGPVNFGVFSALTALAAIVYSLGDLGISNSLVNFLPKKNKEKLLYLSTSLWLEIFIGALIIILFLALSFVSNTIVPGSLRNDFLLAGVISFNYLLIIYTQGYFTGVRTFWPYTASQLIDSGAKILIVFFIFRAGGLTIGTALTANIISTLLALIVTFGSKFRFLNLGLSKDVFWDIFHFSKWIAVSRIFTVMISRIDVVLLNILAGGYAAGIFSAASRVTILFAMMAAGLNSVINPRFSSFNSPQKIVSYAKKLLLLVSGIAVLMILVSFFAEPIITLVYGEQYTASISVFRNLTLVMIPFLYTVIFNSILIYGINELKYFTKLMATQTLIIIITDLILIPSISYYAPVLALLFSNLFVFIASAARIKARLGITWLSLIGSVE